jgi:anthranilate synthase/aminodeoxychorismate synthase-like glutamine amidotransferase
MSAVPRILVLDNQDSFTFNVVQGLRAAGAATGVLDSRALSARTVPAMRLDGLVISPGPGRPANAGYSLAAIKSLAGRIPVWGICLGHQCLAELRGARLVTAGRVMHGKTSVVVHDGHGLFEGLPQGVEVMRYHSLLVDSNSLPPQLELTAWTREGEVMGVRCRETGAEGVQFHPESVLGDAVTQMLAAFVARCQRSSPAALAGGRS